MDVEEIFCLGLWGSMQLELLVIDLNHRFVERDLIRFSAGFGLYITLLDPIVDHFSATFSTHITEQFDDNRQRQARKMQLNNQHHRLLGFPLALHKSQVDPVSITAGAAVF